MRKILAVLAIVIFSFVYLTTSAFADKYGEELQRKYADYTPDKYPNDTYIYIQDEKIVELNKDGTYRITECDMYKILKEEAKFELGEQTISFNSAFEKIEDIKAVTISPSGEVQKASEIHDFSPYVGYPLYSSNKLKIISLPGVVENSIIEIRKTVVGKKIFKGEYWDNWYFQFTVPILECSYKITLPADKKIYISKTGLDIEPTITRNGKYITYYWHKENIDRIEIEEMAPSLFCAIPQIALSTIGDWQKLGSLVWELYESKIKADNLIIEKTKELTKNKLTDLEKLESILKYIQDNFRYVSLSFGNNELEPHEATKTFMNKYGDCKDQCALVAAMLGTMGIESTPTMVHYSYDEPIYKDVPSPNYFNHMILKVQLKEKSLLIDPLIHGCAPEEMYLTLDNTNLFFFNSSTVWFEKIKSLDISNYTSEMKVKIILKEDGSVEGEIKIIPEKARQPNERLRFKGITDRQKEEFCRAFISLISPQGEVTAFDYADPQDYSKPFYIEIKFKAQDFEAITGNYIILDLARFTGTASFSKPIRTQPIVSYFPACITTSYEYIIPEGYAVEYLPESFLYDTPLDTLSSSYNVIANTILVEHKEVLKVVELPPSSYKDIREIYDKVTKEGKKRIILKKRNI